MLLAHQPELEVVGEGMDAKGLLAEVEMIFPDLVLLDWSLQHKSEGDLLLDLREVCPHPSVIVLSEIPEVGAAALSGCS